MLSNPNQGNSSIYIHFEDFYLETHQDCQSDVLEFRVGESNQGTHSPIHIYNFLLLPEVQWPPNEGSQKESYINDTPCVVLLR